MKRLLGIVRFATLAAAEPAAADSVSLSFMPATPQSYEYFAVTVSGHTTSSDTLVVVRDFGPGRTDAGCTAREPDNPGDIAIQQAPSGPGDFSYAQADGDRLRFPHGRYLFCGYVEDAAGNTLASTQRILAVTDRNSLAISVKTPRIADGRFATVHFHGFNDSENGSIAVKRKPAGAGACAGRPDADPGTTFDASDAGGVLGFDGDAEINAGQVSQNDSGPVAPGQYRLCAWLVDASGVLAGPSSALIAVLPPHATLNLTLPFLAAARTPFTVPVSYTTSTSEKLFVALLPGGRLGQRCPASRDAVRGLAIDVVAADSVFAEGGQQVRISAPRAGDYLACFWIQRTASDGRGPVAVGDVIRVLPRGRAPAQFLGSTSQPFHDLTFAFAGGRVFGMTIRERERCTRRGQHFTHEGETTLTRFDIGRGGRFHRRFGLSGPGGVVAMTGRIAGNRASGSFTETVRMARGAICQTGRVTFHAQLTGHSFG